MHFIKRVFIAPWLLCSILTGLIILASLTEQPTLLKWEYPLYDQLQKFRKIELKHQIVLISTDTGSSSGVPMDHREINLLLKKVQQSGAKSITLLTAKPETETLPQSFRHIITPLYATTAKSTHESSPDGLDMLPGYIPLPNTRQLLAEFNNPLAFLRLDRPEDWTFHTNRAGQSGHLIFTPDGDGKIRHLALFLPWRDHLLPALPLKLLLQEHSTQIKEMDLIPGELSGTLKAGSVFIPVQGYYRLAFDQSHPQLPFATYSYRDLLDGQLPADSLKSKNVLVGPTSSYGDRHLVAGYGFISTSEITALATSTLFNETAPKRPHWAWLVESAVTIYFSLLLIFLIPMLSFLSGLAVLLFFLATWGAAVTGSLILFGIWFKVIPATLLCLSGFILIHWQLNSNAKKRSDRENNRLFIERFKEQGLLDLALEKALQLQPGDKSDKELLYSLGLEFERKRKAENAATIYRYLLHFGRFRDAKNRLQQIESFGHSQHIDERNAKTVILSPGREKPTLGRYRIERELGQGAMGTVYLGIDPKINRKVAIKTLEYSKLEPDDLKKTKERFFREAEAAGRLRHHNIVTIYDAGEESDLAFLAMELLEGQDLSHFCTRKKRLPVPQVVDLIHQISEALSYAHKNDVVHRDIKPANMILQPNGQIKVADFGIAQVASNTHTETGIVLGTPSYMSPEQVSGKKVDGRSDLFSLGAVMYELLSGIKPFTGDDLTTLLYNISHGKSTPLVEVRPGLPKACYTIVNKMLQKNLTRRYKSAAVLSQDLNVLLTQLEKK